VAEAYIAGLEQLAAKGGDLAGLRALPVSSFSRIDTLVDSMVGEKLKSTSDPTSRRC